MELNTSDLIDPIELSQRLIRRPSVTPIEGGALDELQAVLEGRGFKCTRLVFSEFGTPDVDNLYARICLLYTSPSPRDSFRSRMPSSA